jgi:hypothetical protein
MRNNQMHHVRTTGNRKTGPLSLGWSVALLALLLGPAPSAAPVGTAFNYQGRLNHGTNPANGRYDLRFTLYDAASGGTQVGLPQTTNALAVSNGFFNVTLDFGAGVFTGDARWLDIAVKTNGAASYTALVPRQPLAPTPYALYAPSSGSAASATVANSAGANAVSTASLQANSITTEKIANAAISAAKLDSSIGFWNKSGNNLFYSAGNVGIGTDNPTAALDVAGGIRSAGMDLGVVSSLYPIAGYYTELAHNLRWDAQQGWVNKATGPGSALTVLGGANEPGGFSFQVSPLPTDAPPGTPANLISALRINSTGNVGIGIWDPTAKLDVAGPIKATGMDLAGDFRIRGTSGGFLIGSAPGYYSDIWHNLYWAGDPAWRNTSQGPGVMLRFYGGANEPGALSFQVSPLPTSAPAGSDAGMQEALRINADRSITASGRIHANGGLVIENRTSDPPSPVTGQIWLRTDL